jgi:hypothetical protein
MTTVVAVMDAPSFSRCTDVIVVVQPASRRLLWVPRDLFCPRLGERINHAYARGGSSGLIAALAEHRIAAENTVCLRPDGIRPALADCAFTIPVRASIEARYHGETFHFRAPVDRLWGERIHAWIGARDVKGERRGLPDLNRIARQQELVAVLLGERFDFARFLAPGLPVEVSSSAAVEALSGVRSTWRIETLDGLILQSIDGEHVLVRGDLAAL